MNERIKELMVKAGFLNKDEESIEYFAELIVKECISTLDQDDGATHHSELLLEHFGVE